jgi:8-oxo-dGTP diphosphatase
VIETAGGLVWRLRRGAPHVLVVHRPRDDDWSLPKGKVEAGEAARDAALREVQEETGLRCTVGPKVAEVRYDDRKGRERRVRYWSMQPVDGSFTPNDEVDQVRWVRADRASRVLTHDHDRRVVQAWRTGRPPARLTAGVA